MNSLSKDQIKDRLLKRAAKQWGYSDVELENVFDPIVNLLFDVCAKELEKISNEIFSSRRRITERLIEILTPSTSIKATAARGIIKAYPIEDELVLNDYHQFSYKKKEVNPYKPNESAIKSYSFGATKAIKLNRNKITYVVLPNGINEIVNDQFKEVVSSKNFTGSCPHSTIWLGMKHEGDGVVKNLMFYFYLKNIQNRNLFFHFLHRADWYLNDQKLEAFKGYNNDEKSPEEEKHMMQQDFYHLDKIQEHISDYYKDNFITIKDEIVVDEDKYKVPVIFESFIPKEDLKNIQTEKLLWLRLEFPNIIGTNILSEIFCSNNCFPVINKKLNEIQGNIKDILNIYPLRLNDEYFLELFSIYNDQNNEVEIISNNEDDEPSNEDFAYLRYGGISRFDERNAIEEVSYLIDLVRDEASAFSRLGNDFIDTNLKEINQIISRFKNRISEVGVKKASNPYLVLNTTDKNEKGTLFVKYWTTDGESANKINAFSKLALDKGVDIDKDGIQFISTTQGGKNELSNSDKIYAYRENLISNRRVVTRQDIIILCKNHFGEAVNKIEVKNGIQNSLDSNVGYTPTIDVYIERANVSLFSEDEWEFLKDDLKLLIENRAINIVPFRVIFTN